MTERLRCAAVARSEGIERGLCLSLQAVTHSGHRQRLPAEAGYGTAGLAFVLVPVSRVLLYDQRAVRAVDWPSLAVRLLAASYLVAHILPMVSGKNNRCAIHAASA